MPSQCRTLWALGGARAIALVGTGIFGLAGFAVPGAGSAQRSPVQHVVVIYLENHSFDNVHAARGTLPSFSVVTPGGPDFLNSCHNGMSMTACDNWAGKLVSAVENGPDWSSTAVFITFDDCGCFYDQAPPPRNADGTQQGPRAPLIIVSPYAKPGYTDTTATTFAGILAYVEQTFGLGPLGVNGARAYPFTNAFNYSQLPLKPARMITRPLPASARRIHLTPGLAHDPT